MQGRTTKLIAIKRRTETDMQDNPNRAKKDKILKFDTSDLSVYMLSRRARKEEEDGGRAVVHATLGR